MRSFFAAAADYIVEVGSGCICVEFPNIKARKKKSSKAIFSNYNKKVLVKF